MNEQQEIAALEAELAALKEEGAALDKGESNISSLKQPAAWIGKTAAKAAVSPLNIPVAIMNVGKWARGSPQIPYPSEKVGEGIDYLTSGASKAKPGFQESAEPYVEGLLSMPFGGGTAKAVQVAGKAVANKGIPYAGKALEKVGNFVGAGTAPTARNAAATAGTIYGARHAAETYQDTPWAPLVGGVVGGMVGRSAATGAKGLTKVPKVPSAYRDMRAKAALRQSTIGEPFLEDVVHDLGGKDILSQSVKGAGELAQKGTSAYKQRAENLFNALEKRVDRYAKDMRVSAEKPLSWAVGKFNELDDPVLKAEFMRSPLGMETKKLMGLSTGMGADDFSKALKKNPDLLNKDYSFRDVLRYRRNIDNSLSSKAWNQIGSIDEGELKRFRGLFSGAIGEKFKALGPSAETQWTRYNQNYEKYAATKIPKINSILEHKFEPSKSYHASKEGIKDLESNAEFTLASLKGKDKNNYALSLIRDMGREGEKFDLHKFAKSFYGLEGGMQRQILLGLSPEMRQNVQKQLSVVKGVNNIANQQKTFGDLMYRSPALSLQQAAKKVLVKRWAGQQYTTPEGRKILTDVAIRNAEKKVKPYVYEPGRVKSSISTMTREAPNMEKTNEYTNLLKEARLLGIDTASLVGE